jgi:ABC-type dipeptide/oligopeptide/nickel transport system permease component
MVGYIRRRLLLAMPTVFGVMTFVFLTLYLVPGDPVTAMVDGPISAEQAQAIRDQLGLDEPFLVQYGKFLAKAVRGDLGRSIRTNRPVITDIMELLPFTIQLSIAAVALAVILGVTTGVIAAYWRNTWIDSLSLGVSLLGVSMPIFWLGLILIYIFSVRLGWFPATGQGSLETMVMPAVTLAWFAGAVITRLVRSSMLDVMNSDYVIMARAKGLNEWAVVGRHALRNALIPVITIVGLQFGNLLVGTVIIETIFARRGLGRFIVTAILEKDFPQLQGAVLFTALFYIIVNLLVDISYGLFDPRIHFGTHES